MPAYVNGFNNATGDSEIPVIANLRSQWCRTGSDTKNLWKIFFYRMTIHIL
jgi:protein tyrosine phosphatase (PTP) superfamily phosphohydrolase (DUF442 family)